MSAPLHALTSYLEATLLQWNCRETTAPHAARAMVEALSLSGSLEQGWSQAVEHLAVARILYRLEGADPMERFLHTVYSGRMLATARALAMLEQPIHSCAKLLESGLLRKHSWQYSGMKEDWTLDLQQLMHSPDGIELGITQALRRTLEFIAPVWDRSAGAGRLNLCMGRAGTDPERITRYIQHCTTRLAETRSWTQTPVCCVHA